MTSPSIYTITIDDHSQTEDKNRPQCDIEDCHQLSNQTTFLYGIQVYFCDPHFKQWYGRYGVGPLDIPWKRGKYLELKGGMENAEK